MYVIYMVCTFYVLTKTEVINVFTILVICINKFFTYNNIVLY